jgi:hypothetical protein
MRVVPVGRPSTAARGGVIAAAGVAALALVLTTAQVALAASRPAYTTTPAPFSADPEFTVTYSGAGDWRTRYHATPSNPGGRRDTNDVRDSSTQRWRLRFRRPVAIPVCGPPPAGGADPCEALAGPNGARGPTAVTARVDHVHVDGPFRSLNRTVRCELTRRTGAAARVAAAVDLRYAPGSGSIEVTARNPVSTALTRLPTACPRQGDSLDRLLDNYFTPGFSFDPAYGSDRWFTSRTVGVPADVFHRSATISMRLADTRAGTPPRACAVREPAIERCRTRGSWSGVLTFTRRPPRAAVAAVARAPRSGRYTGRAGGRPGLLLYVTGRSVSIVAFPFACGRVTGRTSLSDMVIRRVAGRYRFALRAHSIVSYSDERPDQNATVEIRGTFSRLGTAASGTLRVKSSRCGDRRDVPWSARRP